VLQEIVLAAGTDAATVIVYDNTAASGDVICRLAAAANASESYSPNVAFSKGLTLAYSGPTPTASLAVD
jgi:hypothetical protein